MTDEQDPDALVTLTQAATEFEAATIVEVLRDSGIDAFAFGSIQTMVPLAASYTQVPVQVRYKDLGRAQEAIKKRIADSVDLDWNEVNVGDESRVDPPLPTVLRGPTPAKAIAIAVIIFLIAIGMLALIARWL